MKNNILNSETFGMPWYGDSSPYADFPSQGTPGEMKTFLHTSKGKISPSSGGEFIILMLVLFSKTIHHTLKLAHTGAQPTPQRCSLGTRSVQKSWNEPFAMASAAASSWAGEGQCLTTLGLSCSQSLSLVS